LNLGNEGRNDIKISRRRMERHTSIGSLPLPLSVLSCIQVTFVKAYLPTSKLSSPRYVMQITNTVLGQTWEIIRPFRSFFELKEKMLKDLDHGHFCNSDCPWLYMHLSHNFPRRHFFRGRNPCVISVRLVELQKFLDTILRLFREIRNQQCRIVSHKLPKIIYDFLHEGIVVDRAELNIAFLSRSRSSRIQTDEEGNVEENCYICSKRLENSPTSSQFTVSTDSSNSLTFCSSEGEGNNRSSNNRNSSTNSSPVISSVTTLRCGHRFHDECILMKLNEKLACPICKKSTKSE
jgi:hypothetical protein